MSAESQIPFALYSQQELLRRPLEPDSAFAIDSGSCRIAEDAFSARVTDTEHGVMAQINAYIPDVSILNHYPWMIDHARKVAARKPGDVLAPMLPWFVKDQLTFKADHPEGAPALAIRYTVQYPSCEQRNIRPVVSLVDIERTRVRISAVTHEQFALLVNNGDEIAFGLALARRMLQSQPYRSDVKTSSADTVNVVTAHNTAMNRLIGRTMRHLGAPALYKYQTLHDTKKKGYNNSDSMAYFGVEPKKHDCLEAAQYLPVSVCLRKFYAFATVLNLVAVALEDSRTPFTSDILEQYANSENARILERYRRREQLEIAA